MTNTPKTKRQTRSEQVFASITPSERDALDALALDRDLTRSDAIREAVRMWIKQAQQAQQNQA
jgi:metal-responsive CopG/Arc/MetJ family transcriptional regulator